MNEKIKIDGLPKVIEGIAADYSAVVAKANKRAIDKTAEEAVREAQMNAPRRSGKGGGKYAKSIASKVAYEDAANKRVIVYVKPPHYRLTHLLERGHRTRNGRMTRAFPHMGKAEKLAERRLPELLKQNIEGIQ